MLTSVIPSELNRISATRAESSALILSHWPDDYDANSLMGALLTDLGEPDEAIAHLDRAIRIDPSDVLAYGHKVSAL